MNNKEYLKTILKTLGVSYNIKNIGQYRTLYCPEYSLCIEIRGISHFKTFTYNGKTMNKRQEEKQRLQDIIIYNRQNNIKTLVLSFSKKEFFKECLEYVLFNKPSKHYNPFSYMKARSDEWGVLY
jgi:septum formation topological specificity factor MinE